MLEQQMVRVRFRRDHVSQPMWVFVGKVVYFSADWLGVEGKGVLVFRREAVPREQRTLKGQAMVTDASKGGGLLPASVDAESRVLVFPRESIANIRILPHDFDLSDIRVLLVGRRIMIDVDGAPDTFIDEISEG